MASHGIHGAVDAYGDLPDPNLLDLDTTYLVRRDEGAPNGAGLYWVRKCAGVRSWALLDSLSMQEAGEIPYNNETSGLPAGSVQEALDFLSGGGAALGTVGIHVDPVNGIDSPGRGSAVSPYRTIGYAYSQVPDLGNDTPALTQWCSEQIVFCLAPGEYAEGDIALGLKRAHTVLRGQGVEIQGSILWQAELTDIPTLKEAILDDGLTIKNAAGVPWPLTGFPSPTLMLMGETPGFDAGAQCRSFMVNGAIKLVMGDCLDTSGGWMERTGPLYPAFLNVYVDGGFTVEGLAKSTIPSVYADNCWFVNGSIGMDCDPVGHGGKTVLYVKEGGAGDGSSWANALGNLQFAIARAGAGCGIHVAEGTYAATSTAGARSESFTLKGGVHFYGGFPAAGGTWASRIPETNITTLTGNGGIDGNPANNSYHVLRVWPLTHDDTRLYGFTITGGYADGGAKGDPDRRGGRHVLRGGGAGGQRLLLREQLRPRRWRWHLLDLWPRCGGHGRPLPEQRGQQGIGGRLVQRLREQPERRTRGGRERSEPERDCTGGAVQRRSGPLQNARSNASSSASFAPWIYHSIPSTATASTSSASSMF